MVAKGLLPDERCQPGLSLSPAGMALLVGGAVTPPPLCSFSSIHLMPSGGLAPGGYGSQVWDPSIPCVC